jgi:hypothetical protein
MCPFRFALSICPPALANERPHGYPFETSLRENGLQTCESDIEPIQSTNKILVSELLVVTVSDRDAMARAQGKGRNLLVGKKQFRPEDRPLWLHGGGVFTCQQSAPPTAEREVRFVPSNCGSATLTATAESPGTTRSRSPSARTPRTTPYTLEPRRARHSLSNRSPAPSSAPPRSRRIG